MKIQLKVIAGVLLVAVLVAGIVLLPGYLQKEKPKESQEIKIKLAWLHMAQFAGLYVANEKGYYATEGLDATLEPFSFEDPPIDAVAKGNADFGIVGADELILARAKGLPIKAVAVIYKTTPVCAYSLKTSGITKPQDFIGKTVGLQRETNVEYLYYAMMAKLGINRSQIKEVSIGYDASELLNGTTDVSTGYFTDQPHQAIEAGYDVNTILVADYGANIYADVVFATEDTINNNPELVEGFLRATLKGWQYAVEHENEAVDITLKYAPDGTKSHETYMLRNSIPLIHTGERPIGWMEKADWDQVQNILLEQKILDKSMNINEAYTMEFLEKIYGKQ